MHYDKFKGVGVQGVFRHCERYTDKDGNYIKFSNENIDKTRTHLNYNLGPQGNQYQRMKERLSQLEYRKQKNNTVLCGWVLTAPKNLEGEELERFFKRSYKFLEGVYGKENVVSAYVHMDEASPHMHFLFVPGFHEQTIDKDTKEVIKDRWTLSAPKLTDRGVLARIHDDLQKEIDQEFGSHKYLVRSDEVEDRAKGSVPVELMKKALSSLEDKAELLQIDCDYYKQKIAQQERVIAQQKQEISQKKIEKGNLLQELEDLKNDISNKNKTKFFLNKEIRKQQQLLQDTSDTIQRLLDKYQDTMIEEAIQEVKDDIKAAEKVLDEEELY